MQLKRLIQELQKYVSENEIIDFLCKLDTFTYNGFNNKINDDETMIKAVNAVKSFLFKVIYISSKTKGLSSDEIDSIFKWYAEAFSIGALTGNGKILKSSFEENMDIFNNFKSEKRSI